MDFPTHTYPGASYFVSLHCVVLENIHTTPPLPPRRATEIQRGWGGGGPKRRQFPRGWGLLTGVFFLGGLSTFGELLINNSFSVEQAISFFYCYRCFKASIIVWIDHPFIYVRLDAFFTSYAIVFFNYYFLRFHYVSRRTRS